MSSRRHITDLSREEIEDWAVSIEQKPYRAIQLFQWLYLQKALSWDMMTNISKKVRHVLKETFLLRSVQIVTEKAATDGTVKFLQRLTDGYHIESVLLRHEKHNTVCISTQVGCAMGCRFCLTAGMGLKRNLTAGEMVEQVLNAFQLLPEGETIRNIVYMGMGEPFHNYDNTMKSLDIFQDPHGFNFSARRITVSTSGLIPEIKQFAREEIKANLAISLNGVTQEARKNLMPVSKRYSLEELIQACRTFPRESRGRITFEYILLKDITDSLESARKLVKLLHGTKSKVNLISYNENPDLEFKSPTPQSIRQFQQYLLDHGLIATLRASKGEGISAACGQLATKEDPTPRDSLS